MSATLKILPHVTGIDLYAVLHSPLSFLFHVYWESLHSIYSESLISGCRHLYTSSIKSHSFSGLTICSSSTKTPVGFMLVFVFQCVLSSWERVFLNGTTSTGCWTSLTGNLSLTCGSWEENIPTGATPRSSTTRPSVRTQPQPYSIVISLKLFQRRRHSIAFIIICCLIKKVMMNEKWGMVCSFSVTPLKSLHNGGFFHQYK